MQSELPSGLQVVLPGDLLGDPQGGQPANLRANFGQPVCPDNRNINDGPYHELVSQHSAIPPPNGNFAGNAQLHTSISAAYGPSHSPNLRSEPARRSTRNMPAIPAGFHPEPFIDGGYYRFPLIGLPTLIPAVSAEALRPLVARLKAGFGEEIAPRHSFTSAPVLSAIPAEVRGKRNRARPNCRTATAVTDRNALGFGCNPQGLRVKIP